jgi:hypothetical protein
MAEWHPESVLRVFEYGAQRFVNDRVGGSDSDTATKVAEAQAIMDKIKSGDWARSRGESVAPEVEIRRTMIATLVKAQVGKDAWNAEWKDREDFEERIDEVYANQPDDKRAAIDTAVAEELARRAEKAKSLAALKSGLSL